MAVQRVLDLARIDVVATGDDHLLLAVDNRIDAVRVDLREVAGVAPAVAEDFRRRGGIVPVPGHHVRTGYNELADLPGADISSVGADESHASADRRASGRARGDAPAGDRIGQMLVLAEDQV